MKLIPVEYSKDPNSRKIQSSIRLDFEINEKEHEDCKFLWKLDCLETVFLFQNKNLVQTLVSSKGCVRQFLINVSIITQLAAL